MRIFSQAPKAILITSCAAMCCVAASSSTASANRPVQVVVDGPDHPIRIVRDADGVPHVYARSELDGAYGQGWIQAQDRLFQLDVSRRNANGTLAELLGSQALSSDVQLRTLGVGRGAQASEAALSSDTRAALQAFADGVNAWVASNPLPAEYAALELTQFAPWTVLDSLAVAKALAFSLSFDLGDTDRTEALMTLRAVGEGACAAGLPSCFDGTALFFEDLYRSAPFDATTTIPEAQQPPPRTARAYGRRLIPTSARARLRAYIDGLRSNPFLAPCLDRRDSDTGSNEWAVSGRLTRSGRPIMANDPHLSLNSPATFYPGGIHAGAFDAVGMLVPGLPYVVQGQNRRISWGSTVNPLDVTDVFQESIVVDPSSPSGLSILHDSPDPTLDQILLVQETFRANTVGDGLMDNVVTVPPGGQVPQFTLIVPRRNNGPIIALDQASGTAFSVAYTGSSGTREAESFRKINLARNLAEFRAALELFDVGSQNFSYADRFGNIAYITAAESPLREDLEAGTVTGLPPYFVRDGTGGNDWIPQAQRPATQAIPYRTLPSSEMPQIVNPRRGFFVNANNDPVGVTLDNDPMNTLRPTGGIYYLSAGYADGLRASRITRRLEEAFQRGRVDLDDMASVQADVKLGDAEVFVPYIKRAWRRARGGGAPAALTALRQDRRLREAVRRLRRWDFSTPTGLAEGYDERDVSGHLFAPTQQEIDDSVAATIYSVWRGQILRRVIDDTMNRLATAVGQPSLPTPTGSLAMSALRTLFERFPTAQGVGESGVDFFVVPGMANADDRMAYIILRSLADALDRLAGEPFAPAFHRSTDQDNYRWGRLHRLVLDSPLGGPFSLPSAASGFVPPLSDLPGYPVDGGYSVADASSHSPRAQNFDDFMFGSGPNRRYVGEMGRFVIRARTSLPGGVQGSPGGPLYANMLTRWLTNDGFPVRPTFLQVQRGAIERIVLVPR